MKQKGVIGRQAMVSNTDSTKFYEGIREQIKLMGDLDVDVQYQVVADAMGNVLFTALLIGKYRYDSE